MVNLERLTWPQIREQYPDRWVVMADHDLDEGDPGLWKTARVLAQGATRGEAVGRAREALNEYQFYGCRYTGTIHGPLSQLKQLELQR